MDSQKIKVILVVILSAIAALYLGIAAATAQTVAILWVVGILAVVFVLALGKNIWLLIPIALALGGGINALPGSPRVVWVAMAVCGGVFLLRFALRRGSEFTFRLSWLDFAILLQAFAVGQAYLRNPSGIALLGGDTAGGKAYFVYAFAILAYILLAVVPTNIRMVRLAVILMIVIGVLDGMLGLASEFLPGLAALILPIYSGVSFASASNEIGADAETDRVTGGKSVGEVLGRAVFTLFPPATTLNPLHMLRFLMMATAVGTTVISGFRSSMGLLLIFFVVGSLVRGRVLDLVVAGAIGFVGLAGIMVIGVDKLPFGAQRILSVLPVGVDERIKESAQKSSQWRFDMWRLALTTDRYIKNKMLGDGFSFRADELAAAQDAVFGDKRRAAGMKIEDIMLARGAYHGFHVEAIRMTGVLGLVCALVALGIFFRSAWKHIRYYKGRPEWGYVLFICVPFLIHPFYLMLVFGDYRFGFPDIMIMAGMLKILDNIRRAESLDLTRQSPAAIEAVSLPSTPNRARGLPAVRTR
jgi:hypothetical protein